jgi:16S rRNA (cytosine1402-N4)-methyltransferase
MAGVPWMAQNPSHLPVMFTQVMEALRVLKDGKYLDGTFGRGGHACGVLDRLGPEGKLLVMDKDPVAIAHANELRNSDRRVAVYQGSFAALKHWSDTAEGLDGVLFDLGVSSPQLDVAERGFSFRNDGPLDMRMDNQSGQSAADWLAQASEKEITDVLWTYGEEKMSRKIARTIVERRTAAPLTRTTQLADLIASVVGRGDGKIHPATRSFQAIRIFINHELDDLEDGLQAAYEKLNVGGRLAVISFHSLEDRIVKQFIAKHAKAPAGNRRMPIEIEFTPGLKDIAGAIRADDDEIKLNPRSRSAVLRVAEKLPLNRAGNALRAPNPEPRVPQA